MDNDLVIDLEDKDFSKKLEFAMIATTGSSAYKNSRDRPYNGQPQTDHGERGKTEVRGLTMRDISDCFVQGFLAASDMPELQDKTFPLDKKEEPQKTGTWKYEDLYKIKGNFDPQAVIQNAMCFIESYMGIFPNIKGIKIKDILGEDLGLDEDQPPEDGDAQKGGE